MTQIHNDRQDDLSPPEGGRLDFHHHLSPPALSAQWRMRGLSIRPALDWTPQRSIEDMDRGGVSKAFVSIPDPWWHADGNLAVELARTSNEYAARLQRDLPGRFQFFATLPLPYIDACLREIEYSFEELNAAGVGLMTSYNNVWLGDPAFSPVLDELNRRKAVVYVHPGPAERCRDFQYYVLDSTIEYGTDTTRAIASVLFTGTASRCSNIRFIFSHAGGSMPFLIQRFLEVPMLRPFTAANVPEGVLATLRRFYYDIALATHPIPLGALAQLVPSSQILFGSDFPHRKAASARDGLHAFGFSAADLACIERQNGLAMMGERTHSEPVSADGQPSVGAVHT